MHGQGIDRPADGVPRGAGAGWTNEAISLAAHAGFSLALQWHPEWRASEDATSQKIFAAFWHGLPAVACCAISRLT